MTSFGRGRGWRQNCNQNEQSLRRPGDTIVNSDDIVRDIIDKMQVACDTHEHISLQLIQEIADLMSRTIYKGNLKDTCNALWKKIILEDSLITKMAMLFSNTKIALIEDSDRNAVRNNFLRFLQDNYMSKDKNRVEDQKKFANIVLLHAEVYYCLRLNNGDRLQILAEPLIHYLEDVLQDNPYDNIYFILIEILRSGKDLYAACPEQLNSLIMTIRQLLLNSQNCQSNTILLLIIELANNSYEIKDPQVKQFYVSNIKSLSFEYPFSQVEVKVIVDTKTDEYDDQPLEADDKQQMVKVKNDVSEHGNYSKNPNVPRAIRGSGTFDKSKKGDNVNTKLKSLKITPPKQKNNKGWDHDDRFHKDYE